MHRQPSNRSRARVLARVLAVLALGLAILAPSAAAADRTRPTTPTNLRVTATTTSSVSLAWNASTDNSGSFFYVMTELNSGQTRTIPQTQTTFTWTGLLPSRTYRFRVYAQDLSGNRSFTSNTVSATTSAAPPLTAPANVRQTGAAFTSVTVAWDAVGGATSYRVVGNVQAEGARRVVVRRSSRVGGSVQVKQGGSATVLDSRVNGDIQYDANSGLLVANENRVGGNKEDQCRRF